MSEMELKLPCVMSGDRETLSVRRIGKYGVSFDYNDDCSVIVNGANLIALAALIDGAIAQWKLETPAAQATSKTTGNKSYSHKETP